MARGQKKEKKELTPEERLQQALVPEKEWPYQLPEGWKWVRIGGISDLYNGRAFKPTDWSIEGLPIVRIQNLNDREAEYNHYSGDVDEQYALHGGELLFAWSGTPGTSFGAHIWWGKEAVLNQHIFKMKFDESMLNKRYFMYAINQQLNQLISVAHGGAGLQHVTKGVFENTAIPLPDLITQERVVSFIDEQRARLDEVSEEVQSVLDNSEERKQSILHKAFTGELTEKWRVENNQDNSWTYSTLENVCSSIYDGDHMPPPKASTGIPFLVISNVNNMKLSFENTRYVPEEYFNSLTETRKPQMGDILYTLVGSYGIPVIVDTDRPFCFQRHMALLKPKSIETRYLWYVLQTNVFFQEATNIATGTAQMTVPIKGLRRLEIPICKKEEQKEIVRILDKLYVSESQVDDIAKLILDQISTTKKSILSKAFHGELIR